MANYILHIDNGKSAFIIYVYARASNTSSYILSCTLDTAENLRAASPRTFVRHTKSGREDVRLAGHSIPFYSIPFHSIHSMLLVNIEIR